MATKVMISLPDQLFTQMKALIPARQRSKIIAKLLQQEIQSREADLYKRAKILEKSTKHKKEIKEWDKNLSGDGLDDI
jgi:metal-responsive CopG/Arc/MetJ family transcriptional regulator